jgi:hypothetical protein
MPCSKQTPTDLTILTLILTPAPHSPPTQNPSRKPKVKMLEEEEKIQLGYYRILNLQVS